MSDKPEYCCIWCHELLTKEQAYVNHRGSTICAGCRGLGAVMLSKRKCSRGLPHSVATPPAADDIDGGRRSGNGPRHPSSTSQAIYHLRGNRHDFNLDVGYRDGCASRIARIIA